MNTIERLDHCLAQASAVLIGAGAGLSAAAGIDYSGPDFQREFADYIAKYGFTDLYTSGFYPFSTEEERWARWARHIDYAALKPPAMPLYQQLLALVKDRDYFVITTNVDGQFEKAGFEPERLFAVQGDYREMQCARACHPKVYSNLDAVRKMLSTARNLTIPADSVPNCPVCGGSMAMHLRVDETFIEDGNWHAALARYQEFLLAHDQDSLLLLELGVGFNTPGIIRFPFEQITLSNPAALLVRVNTEVHPPRFPIQNRLLEIGAPLQDVLADLVTMRGSD